MGDPGRSPCSFPAAMRLPVKVRLPMTTSRPIVVIFTRSSPTATWRTYSEIPIRLAASAPRECESAVRPRGQVQVAAQANTEQTSVILQAVDEKLSTQNRRIDGVE